MESVFGRTEAVCKIFFVMCSNCCMSWSGDREGLWLQSVLVSLLRVLQVRKVWYKDSGLTRWCMSTIPFQAFVYYHTAIIINLLAIVISTLTLHEYSFLYSLLCVMLHPCHLEMSFMHAFDPQDDMRSSCGSLLDKSSLRLSRRCPHQWVKWLISYTFPLIFMYHPILLTFPSDFSHHLMSHIPYFWLIIVSLIVKYVVSCAFWYVFILTRWSKNVLMLTTKGIQIQPNLSLNYCSIKWARTQLKNVCYCHMQVLSGVCMQVKAQLTLNYKLCMQPFLKLTNKIKPVLILRRLKINAVVLLCHHRLSRHITKEDLSKRCPNERPA